MDSRIKDRRFKPEWDPHLKEKLYKGGKWNNDKEESEEKCTEKSDKEEKK